jgi:hypothetical protein
MSLDGFVARLDDDPAELFDWYWSVIQGTRALHLRYAVRGAAGS